MQLEVKEGFHDRGRSCYDDSEEAGNDDLDMRRQCFPRATSLPMRDSAASGSIAAPDGKHFAGSFHGGSRSIHSEAYRQQASVREVLLNDLQALDLSEKESVHLRSPFSSLDGPFGLANSDGGHQETPSDAAVTDGLNLGPEILNAIRVLEQVEQTIEMGPRWKLENYLEAVDKLLAAQEVVMKVAREPEEEVVLLMQAKVSRALVDLEEEFRDALVKSSKPIDPAAFSMDGTNLAFSAAPTSGINGRPGSAQGFPRSASEVTVSTRPHSAEDSSCGTSSAASNARRITRSASLFTDDPMLIEFNLTSSSSSSIGSSLPDLPETSSTSSSSCPDLSPPSPPSGPASADDERTRPSTCSGSGAQASVASEDGANRVVSPLSRRAFGNSFPIKGTAVHGRMSSSVGSISSKLGGSGEGSVSSPRPPIPVKKAYGGAVKEWVPSTAAPWLHKIARRLVDGGAGDRCMEQYKQVRAAALKDNLKLLQMVEYRVGALDAMPWPTLEACMKSWMKDARIIMNVLVEGERVLCRQVLNGLNLDTLRCFREMLMESRAHRAIILLGANARAIAMSTKSPEKLFGLLDIFKLVEDLSLQVEEVLKASHKQAALDDWALLPKRMAESVFATFDAFKNVLDSPTPTSPKATKKRFRDRLLWRSEGRQVDEAEVDTEVHAITSYVVNYIRHYLERSESAHYAVTLDRLFANFKDAQGQKRNLEEETLAMLSRLETNMDSRSSDMPHVHRAIFLLNNINYVLQSLSSRHFRITINQSDRLSRREEQFVQAAMRKLAAALGPEGESKSLHPTEVKSRLKKFNDMFEELALEQREWLILSDEIRKTLRIKLARGIKDLYTNFLTPHREELCSISSYRWTPDGVERVILKSFLLFRGIPVAASV